MHIVQEYKEEIQWFVYFLFKGTLKNELIVKKPNYVQDLIRNPLLLDRCFEIFANEKSLGRDYETATQHVAEFILTENYDELLILNPFWTEFVVVSSIFNQGKFEFPVKRFQLKELDGCGTDAVPFFAVWTNVIEIDENGSCTNKNEALRRSNERLLMWDQMDITPPFTDKELEQEIY